MPQHDVVFPGGTNIPGDPLLPGGFLPPQPAPLPRPAKTPAGSPAIGQGALTQFGSTTPQLFQGVSNALTKQTGKGTAPLQGMDPSAFMRFLTQSGLAKANPFFGTGGTSDIGGLLSKLFSIGSGGRTSPLNPAGQDFLLRLARGETQLPPSGGGFPSFGPDLSRPTG